MNLLQRRVTPPRNGSCALAGISVLVTGLTNDSDVRKRCSTLVQQLGGTLLADLPATDEVRSNSHPYSNHLLDPCLYPHLRLALMLTLHHPMCTQHISPLRTNLILAVQAVENGACHPPAEVVVVSDRAMRTLKYVYAVAAGHAIVKPSWLEVQPHLPPALGTPSLVRSSPRREACAPSCSPKYGVLRRRRARQQDAGCLSQASTC